MKGEKIMNINKIRTGLKTSGDKNLIELENIISDNQLVKLFKAFNKTDGSADAVINFLEEKG